MGSWTKPGSVQGYAWLSAQESYPKKLRGPKSKNKKQIKSLSLKDTVPHIVRPFSPPYLLKPYLLLSFSFAATFSSLMFLRGNPRVCPLRPFVHPAPPHHPKCSSLLQESPGLHSTQSSAFLPHPHSTEGLPDHMAILRDTLPFLWHP